MGKKRDLKRQHRNSGGKTECCIFVSDIGPLLGNGLKQVDRGLRVDGVNRGE